MSPESEEGTKLKALEIQSESSSVSVAAPLKDTKPSNSSKLDSSAIASSSGNQGSIKKAFRGSFTRPSSSITNHTSQGS